MVKPQSVIHSFLALALLLFQTSLLATATVPSAQTGPLASYDERQHGIELYQQEKFVEAANLLRKAVKQNKADADAWHYLGLALLNQPKQMKEASKAFETALKLRPNFAPAHLGLSYALLQRNKPAEAIREAEAALSVEPNMPHAHYIIGVVRLRAGARDEALQQAEAAIKLAPQFAPTYLLKSQALASFLDDAIVLIKDESPEARVIRFEQAAGALEKYLQLATNPEEKQTWTEQLESLRFYVASSGKADGEKRVFSGKEVTTKARVFFKPEPSYTERARTNQITGTVVLRAIFTSDGTVKHFLVVSGLPDGLTERAINAARQIKFVPATIAGRPVSMFIQLEYNFNLY